MPSRHPAHTPVAAALLDRHADDRQAGESAAHHLERLLLARAGRTRADVAAELGVSRRTLLRWLADLRALGVVIPGAEDPSARGAGARGGTSPATRSLARREGVTHGHAMTLVS